MTKLWETLAVVVEEEWAWGVVQVRARMYSRDADFLRLRGAAE